MKKKPEAAGYGEPCPKCKKRMIRFRHSSHWAPKTSQPYWFEYWDRCFPCRHFQMYERAKRFAVTPPQEMPVDVQERMDAIKEQLGAPPWES